MHDLLAAPGCEDDVGRSRRLTQAIAAAQTRGATAGALAALERRRASVDQRFDANDALAATGIPNLTLLPAGRTPPNPSELLGSKRMRALLKLASEDFFVIVDSPPLLPVTDGSLLAAAVDGTVLVVRQGRTRKDHLEAAVENLAAVDAHLLGVVMNGVARSQRGGGYAYGYGYESTYHKSHEKYLSSGGSSAKKGRRSRRKARTRS